VTAAHEAIWEHVENVADEFVGVKGHRLSSVSVSLKAKSGLDPFLKLVTLPFDKTRKAQHVRKQNERRLEWLRHR
jgi:hypothetical protein